LQPAAFARLGSIARIDLGVPGDELLASPSMHSRQPKSCSAVSGFFARLLLFLRPAKSVAAESQCDRKFKIAGAHLGKDQPAEVLVFAVERQSRHRAAVAHRPAGAVPRTSAKRRPIYSR